VGATSVNHSPAWIDRLLSEFDSSDRVAGELVAGLSSEQLNWRPDPSAWSVGQCLDHLCVTNDVYLPVISSALSGQPESPVPEIRLGWFGRWFIGKYIEPSPQTSAARAPKKIVPAQRVELSVLDRFLAGNQAVRELVRRAGGHDVNRIRFQNPFIPIIRFTVGTGLEIVSRHQRRHLIQAGRVKQALDTVGVR
jgi:hypothetical protein